VLVVMVLLLVVLGARVEQEGGLCMSVVGG
jgi:hypothetical protein